MIKNVGVNLNTVSNSYSAPKNDKVELNRDEINSSSANKSGSSLATNKVDTIEISYRPLQDSSTIADVKNLIVNDVDKDADMQRVQNLKEQVNNGQYTVDSNEMAKMMLGD